MEYNYIGFVKDKTAVIPAIQRDYVQGAEKNREKRDQFLEALFETLAADSGQINLDFIYGTGNKDEFLPVDGQQRLTTLFLLAWLLKQRANIGVELPKLAYRTRHTTEQFVDHLRNYDFPDDFTEEKAISHHLKEKPLWFAEDWKTDPSISAMLEMLDAMNEMLNRKPDLIPKMAAKFFSDANPIYFESVDMGDGYNLHEDMYVKMNARGKALTDFENWKAEFGDFLKKHYSDVIYSNELTVPEYFDAAIEQNWCDLFWEHALKSWQALSDKEKEARTFPRIDEFFMRFFETLTELLFYAQTDVEKEAKKLNIGNAQVFAGAKDELKRENIFNVYENVQNVLTLFKLLDIFAKIEKQQGLNNFFASLFTAKFDDSSSDKINLFCDRDNTINLFSDIINKGTQTPLNYRLLFFGLSKRLQDYGASNLADFIDFLRVFWGWLCGYKQRNAQEFNVTSNLRVEQIRLTTNVIAHLLTDRDVFKALQTPCSDRQTANSLIDEIGKANLRNYGKYEVVKVLSNYPELHYDLSQLNDAIAGLSVQECCDRFAGFHKLTADQRIIALCKYGFTGIPTWNGWCRYYGADNLWNYIFTSTDTQFRQAFTDYMLQKQQAMPTKDEMGWYMIKYQDFRDSSPWRYFFVESNFTVWAKATGSRMRMGYQNVCPYSWTVIELLDKPSKDKLKPEAYSNYSEQGSIWMPDYKIAMYCVDNGWLINREAKAKKSIAQYGARFDFVDGSITDKEGVYKFKGNVLQDLADKDRIETGLKFLKDFAELL